MKKRITMTGLTERRIRKLLKQHPCFFGELCDNLGYAQNSGALRRVLNFMVNSGQITVAKVPSLKGGKDLNLYSLPTKQKRDSLKLSDEDVRNIRNAVKHGVDKTLLAENYEVSYVYIYDIANYHRRQSVKD